MSFGAPCGGEAARSMGDILKPLLRRKKLEEKGKFKALANSWRAVVGEAVASRSRIRAFKQGILIVEVDSPVLLHELSSFQRQRLLLSMQATAAGRDVAEVRFCLGLSGNPGLDGATGRARKR